MFHTLLGCILFAMLSSLAHAEPLTLRQAHELALSQNGGLAARHQYALSLAAVPAQLSSLPDPVLSLNALNVPIDSFSTTQENMTQLQLGIAQAMPFPGKLGLRADASQHMAEAALDDVVEFRLQLQSRVETSWWNIFYLDRAIETIARNQTLLRQSIRIAEIKYKVGEGLQQDVLLAQLELSKLLDVALTLQSARKQEQASLNAWFNRPASEPIELPQSFDAPLPSIASESELAAQAIRNRPRLAKHNKLIASAESRLALADKDYYPDFKLGAQYGLRNGVNPINRQNRADFASVQLSMSLPMFNGDKYDRQRDQRHAELAQEEFALQDARASVLSEVSQALATYEKAKQQTLLFKTGIIPQATQTVSSMRAGYQVNKVDFLNLVQSQITLYNYETQYWKAFAEAHQSLARLHAAVGQELLHE